MLSTSPDRRAAFHEAAHAVVALEIGVAVQFSVVFDDGAGRTPCEGDADPPERTALAFAGEEAEWNLFGSIARSFGDRAAFEHEIALDAGVSGLSKAALEARGRAIASEIIARRISAVAAIAAEFMRRPFVDGAVRLEAEEIIAIVERSKQG